MVNQEARDFATHVISQFIILLGRNNSGTDFLSVLSTKIPNLDVTKYRSQPVTNWAETLAPKLVDYFLSNYEPTKLKTAV